MGFRRRPGEEVTVGKKVPKNVRDAAALQRALQNYESDRLSYWKQSRLKNLKRKVAKQGGSIIFYETKTGEDFLWIPQKVSQTYTVRVGKE